MFSPASDGGLVEAGGAIASTVPNTAGVNMFVEALYGFPRLSTGGTVARAAPRSTVMRRTYRIMETYAQLINPFDDLVLHRAEWSHFSDTIPRVSTVSVFALPGGTRHNSALRFSLPVRSRKSAFGMRIKFEGRHCKSPGPMR